MPSPTKDLNKDPVDPAMVPDPEAVQKVATFEGKERQDTEGRVKYVQGGTFILCSASVSFHNLSAFGSDVQF